MLARWRRARLFGYLVLLLASGLSSGATAYVHSCPTELATREAGHPHEGTGGHGHHAPGKQCHCIGTCSLAWSSTVPQPVAFETARELTQAVAIFADRSATPRSHPDRLHPPATAPPSTL